MKSLGRQLSLRPFTFSDLHLVHAIEDRAYVIPWSFYALRESLHVGHECMALWDGQNIIGYYIAQLIVDETHLLNICIAPERQGQGLGALLLDEWLLSARAKNAITALLEVRVSNLAAQSLYTKAEFQLLSRRKGYYRTIDGKEDGLVMLRQL